MYRTTDMSYYYGTQGALEAMEFFATEDRSEIKKEHGKEIEEIYGPLKDLTPVEFQVISYFAEMKHPSYDFFFKDEDQVEPYETFEDLFGDYEHEIDEVINQFQQQLCGDLSEGPKSMYPRQRIAFQTVLKHLYDDSPQKFIETECRFIWKPTWKEPKEITF